MAHISIITIVFNNRNGLLKTIQSVKEQTYSGIEYIIVDGGSTDGSVEVVKSNLDCVSSWISEPDNGIYDAINKGVKMANGEWLCIMNSGDVFCDKYVVEKVFKDYTDAKSNASMIYSDYYINRTDGSKFFVTSNHADGHFMHQSIFYKKDLHKIHGEYLVTKPLIVSDFIFIASVPLCQKYKTSVIIASTEEGGISQQGNWGRYQMVCGMYIFNFISTNVLISKIFKLWVINMIPNKIKKVLKRSQLIRTFFQKTLNKI